MRAHVWLSSFALGIAVMSAQVASGMFTAAYAQASPADQKHAFEAAKELGTVEAWDAFLSNYPSGFHADLARAYVKKLAETPSATPAKSGSSNCSRHEVYSSSMKQCIPKSAMCEKNEVYSSSLASCMPRM